MIDPITQYILEKANPCDKFWNALDNMDMAAQKFTGGGSYNISWSDKRIPPALKKKRQMLKIRANQCDKKYGT